MSDDREDRQEPASPKRLEAARREGRIPRSRDLTAVLVVLASGGALYASARGLYDALARVMTGALGPRDPRLLFEPTALAPFLADALGAAWLALAPFLGVCFLTALVAPTLVGGWNLSLVPLVPRWDRLSPAAGLRRLWGGPGAMEMAKAAARIGLIFALVGLAVYAERLRLLGLAQATLPAALAGGGWLLAVFALAALAGLALVALVDVPWQLHTHRRSLAMTRQELREEQKETEGRPQHKAEARRRQRERQLGGGGDPPLPPLEALASAHCLVLGPGPLAVAVGYTPGQAPLVVTLGAGALAGALRAAAVARGIPVLRCPRLAEALRDGAVSGAGGSAGAGGGGAVAGGAGGPIPVRLHPAVARLLAQGETLRRLGVAQGDAQEAEALVPRAGPVTTAATAKVR
jgi:flagellar biosynthetic protein FlhB